MHGALFAKRRQIQPVHIRLCKIPMLVMQAQVLPIKQFIRKVPIQHQPIRRNSFTQIRRIIQQISAMQPSKQEYHN